MYELIKLKSGETVTISKMDDFIEIIRERLGDDMADYLDCVFEL